MHKLDGTLLCPRCQTALCRRKWGSARSAPFGEYFAAGSPGQQTRRRAFVRTERPQMPECRSDNRRLEHSAVNTRIVEREAAVTGFIKHALPLPYRKNQAANAMVYINDGRRSEARRGKHNLAFLGYQIQAPPSEVAAHVTAADHFLIQHDIRRGRSGHVSGHSVDLEEVEDSACRFYRANIGRLWAFDIPLSGSRIDSQRHCLSSFDSPGAVIATVELSRPPVGKRTEERRREGAVFVGAEDDLTVLDGPAHGRSSFSAGRNQPGHPVLPCILGPLKRDRRGAPVKRFSASEP